ncbi:hypothetical protein J6590_026510 [Homalodisca vitripennis]|nr:hypothetical protein J6590_026510 [Homalodisca vitripennis]
MGGPRFSGRTTGRIFLLGQLGLSLPYCTLTTLSLPQHNRSSFLDLLLEGLQMDSMKNRWRHIRDSFVKHLNHLRRGNSVRKKRKYIYHDNLQFLLEPLGDDFTMSNSTGPVEEESYDYAEETSVFSPLEESPKSPGPSRRNSLRIANNTTLHMEPKERVVDVATSNQVDAGELFLLSLLPDYQKLGEDEKIDFRIMCLEFFRAVRRNRVGTPN